MKIAGFSSHFVCKSIKNLLVSGNFCKNSHILVKAQCILLTNIFWYSATPLFSRESCTDQYYTYPMDLIDKRDDKCSGFQNGFFLGGEEELPQIFFFHPHNIPYRKLLLVVDVFTPSHLLQC